MWFIYFSLALHSAAVFKMAESPECREWVFLKNPFVSCSLFHSHDSLTIINNAIT